MLALIDVRIFLISFAIGMFFVYIMDVDKRKVFIYPTPENVDKIQFKDEAKNCFNYKMKTVKCPANENMISKIPLQN